MCLGLARRRSGNPVRIRLNRIFRKSGIFFFLLLRTPWDLRVTPRMVRYHLIRTRSGKSGFFENPDFSFFRLFELKDPTIWVSMDSPGPTGPAGPTAVLFRYFFGTFRYFFRYLTVLDAFLSLNPLQYGCLWTRLDSIRSLVPVPRYCGTFSVLFRYFFGTFSVLFLLKVGKLG